MDQYKVNIEENILLFFVQSFLDTHYDCKSKFQNKACTSHKPGAGQTKLSG